MDNAEVLRMKALENYKFNNLLKQYEKFRQYWIKENKCECVSRLNPKIILNCEHFVEARNKKFAKERKQIQGFTSLFILYNLRSYPQLQNNFLNNMRTPKSEVS